MCVRLETHHRERGGRGQQVGHSLRAELEKREGEREGEREGRREREGKREGEIHINLLLCLIAAHSSNCCWRGSIVVFRLLTH